MVEEDKTKQEETLSVLRPDKFHFIFLLCCFLPLESNKGLLQVSSHAQTSFLFKIALKSPSEFMIITKEVRHLLDRMSDNWP